MKLFQTLLLKAKHYRRSRLPDGNIYEGRYRIIVPPTSSAVRRLSKDLEIEEKNMFYLRHSFLSETESYFHRGIAKGFRTHLGEKIKYKKEKWSKPKLMSEHLAHLKTNESWE